MKKSQNFDPELKELLRSVVESHPKLIGSLKVNFYKEKCGSCFALVTDGSHEVVIPFCELEFNERNFSCKIHF